MRPTYDVVIVGGGIVGLATAMALTRRVRGIRLAVLEKEPQLAAHQTGRNSGVIHSGIYYRPGSLKARLATAGNESMAAFCREHGIPVDVCGKVIVATEPRELPRLERLFQRGRENGLSVTRLDRAALADHEPHVRGRAAIHVPSAGIVDYRQVAQAFGRIVLERDGEIHLNARVVAIDERNDGVTVQTDDAEYVTNRLVNCAGLHSDRVARLAGFRPAVRIVPFRGEYYELRPDRRHLVRNLIYPVPDPAFPFLGVHFTRMIDGSVHAGPNAVLALAREGYAKTSFALRDAVDALGYRGFWRLARRHWDAGAAEILRSLSKRAFVHSLQQLIPAVDARDVIPAHAGVRAQALLPSGALADDFLIHSSGRSVHVCNAPSPAATASIEIGEAIAAQVVPTPTLELV